MRDTNGIPIGELQIVYVRIPSQAERRQAADLAMDRRQQWRDGLSLAGAVIVGALAYVYGGPVLLAIARAVGL